MYQLINDILLEFIDDFKRLSTFRWFATVILGFMVRRHHRGVTSIIDALRLKPKLYHLILHFFRSKGYTVKAIFKRWNQIAMKRCEVVHIGGRVLTAGDHIKIAKEGRRIRLLDMATLCVYLPRYLTTLAAFLKGGLQ